MEHLKITRLKEWANKRFAYKILIDGQEQFELSNGESKSISLEKAQTIQAKLMWGGSKQIDVASNKESIAEIRIKANRGIHVHFPVLTICAFIIGNLVSQNASDVTKYIVTFFIGGMMLFALFLITLGRNRFLDIEVVEK